MKQIPLSTPMTQKHLAEARIVSRLLHQMTLRKLYEAVRNERSLSHLPLATRYQLVKEAGNRQAVRVAKGKG